MLLKLTFTVGATFCFVQLVCSWPTAPGWGRERAPKKDESASDDRLYALLMASMMTCETLASAKNAHCYPIFLPKNRESDRRNHVVASSTMELWVDLRTMEPVQHIYVAVADKYMRKMEGGDAVNLWFEEMDKAMAEDAHLCQRYKESKSKYEKLVVLEPDHLEKEKFLSSDDRASNIDRDMRFKELHLNFIFAHLLNGGDDEDGKTSRKYGKKLKFRALAKTMVEMSKSGDQYEKLQQIYGESLAEVAANVDVVGITDRASSALYRKLKQKLKADPAISAEFEEKKKGILKKLKAKT